MTPPSQHPHSTPELLLAQASWVRELAHRLVADPELADDLAQDTFVAALGSAPRPENSLRGWLATVMRNFLRQNLRSHGQRTCHEEAVVQASDQRDERATDTVIERASVHRQVVDLVLDLDEPYRTVLLLRFFEGLTPTQISKRMDAPVASIKTQLSRGLERLRRRMDEEMGNRETWIAALLPVLRSPMNAGQLDPPGAAEVTQSALWNSVTLGAALVNTKIVVVTVALVAIGGLAALDAFSSDSGIAASPGLAQSPDPLETPAELPIDASPATAQLAETAPPREAVAPSHAPKALPETVAAAPVAIRLAKGRLLDADGGALGGMKVTMGTANNSAVTDNDGGFVIELSAGARGQITIDDPAWTTVLAGVWEESSKNSEALVVAAPVLSLGGITIDGNGVPMSNVTVSYVLPEDFRSRFREILDYSAGVGRSTVAGADGEFLLTVPAVRGGLIRAAKREYEPFIGPVPTFSDLNLELVLENHVFEGQVVRGIVIDARGDAVAGARVALTLDSTVTAQDGTFVIETNGRDSTNRDFGRFLDLVHDTVVAVAPGYMPARFVTELRDESGSPAWPEWVQLELGSSPLSISGRVVDEEGNPRSGIYVWVGDPTLFGNGNQEIVHVESLLAERDEMWAMVETDAHGFFRIDGLLDRPYQLEVMDPSNLHHAVERGVIAGRSNLEITLAAEVIEEIFGRVVDSAGEPIPNVEVRATCDAFQLRYRETTFTTRHVRGQETKSDEDGRFILTGIAKDFVYLRFDGENTVPLEIGRAHEGGLGDLIGDGWREFEVIVSMRCNFQVEIDPDEGIDGIQMIDDTETALPIDRWEGTRRMSMRTFPVKVGRSATFAVADTARFLVLLSGEREVRRVPVALVSGELTSIR